MKSCCLTCQNTAATAPSSARHITRSQRVQTEIVRNAGVALEFIFQMERMDHKSREGNKLFGSAFSAFPYSRLKPLRKKLGRDPAELRQYPSHFDNLGQSLSDPRARRVYRKI